MSELQQQIIAPPGWSARPFWSLFRREKRTGFAEEDLLSVYRDHGVVPKLSRDDNFNKESEDLSSYQLVDKGCLVTNKMKAWQGSIAISRFRGIVSPAYYVYAPLSSEDDQFLHYLLRSDPYIAIYGRISKGVRVNQWDLEHEALRRVPVILPNRDTQKAIADFLDSETSRIDRLIDKKQRMATLLAERRRVAAIHCLDAGLSGFTWQPENQSVTFQFKQKSWVAIRVKNLVSFMTSGSRGWSSLLGGEGEAFIQSGNIGRHMEVDVSSAQRVQPQVGAEADRTLIKTGDVLVCITGGRTGAVGYVRSIDERAYINQHVCLLRARRRVILPELLANVLWSEIGQKQISLCQYGVKQGIGFNEVANLLIPVPPRELQQDIVERISAMTGTLDKLTKTILQSVERLQEMRSALITAAVTGQLDISTWQKGGSTARHLDSIEARVNA